jgi:hypothetical protein
MKNDDFHWQNGYAAFSVSQSNIDEVKKYIENQVEHHRKMTFQDELRRCSDDTGANVTNDTCGIRPGCLASSGLRCLWSCVPRAAFRGAAAPLCPGLICYGPVGAKESRCWAEPRAGLFAYVGGSVSPLRFAPSSRTPYRYRAAWLIILIVLTIPCNLCAQPAGTTTKPASPIAPARLKAAAEGGKTWLLRQQIREGPDAGGFPGGKYSTAVTSLAGLALLAYGHLPGEGEHGRAIDAAMNYVQAGMTPDGYVGGRGDSMYVHAMATLLGLSYVGMSREPEKDAELAEWCRQAVDLIVEAQAVRKPPADQGGWRYSPYTAESDVSVTSWQLLALHAARQCEYPIDDRVFDRGLRYVNSAWRETDEGDAGFLYRPGVSQQIKPGVTGAAVGVKALLEPRRDPRLKRSVEYLDQFTPTWGGERYQGYFFFVTFYMAQAYFQLGPHEWERFKTPVQQLLLEHQAGDGHWPFPPDNYPQSRPAGTVYTTSLALLILALDNQYLPMYQRQAELFR